MAKAKKLKKAKKPKLLKKKKATAVKTRKKVAAKAKRKVSKSKKVNYIQKGYNNITPYLIVKGAAEAIKFYQKVFGAKLAMLMEQPNGMIGHCELKIGDTKIMLGDECPEMGALSPVSIGGTPVGIHLYIKDVDSVIDEAVKHGAKLLRPAENMFYGDRSGVIEDPHGHRWFVSMHVEHVSPAQLKKRMAEAYAKQEDRVEVEE